MQRVAKGVLVLVFMLLLVACGSQAPVANRAVHNELSDDSLPGSGASKPALVIPTEVQDKEVSVTPTPGGDTYAAKPCGEADIEGDGVVEEFICVPPYGGVKSYDTTFTIATQQITGLKPIQNSNVKEHYFILGIVGLQVWDEKAGDFYRWNAPEHTMYYFVALQNDPFRIMAVPYDLFGNKLGEAVAFGWDKKDSRVIMVEVD